MFFKKKKIENEQIQQQGKKKKGCLKSFIIGVVIIVVLGIITIFAIRDVLKVFGVNLKTFNEYVALLNEEVDESELTTNPIKTNDLQTFKQKALESGLTIFDSNGNININSPTIGITENISLFDYEIGAMINNASVQTDGGEQIFNMLELTITEVSNNVFTLKSVVKLNLKEIKKAVGSYAKKLPDAIYLTSVGSVYVVGSRVQTKDNAIHINQLKKEQNDKIVELLKKITGAMNEEDEMVSIMDVNNYIVTEILTTLSQKTNTTPILGNGTFSLQLKNQWLFLL